jgi:predicted GNAT family acetyltransferase
VTELDIAVADDPDQHRYAVTVDGVLAGGAYYEHRDGRVVFTHTEVDPAWEGRGVGSALARYALDDVRHTGRHAIPLCPFIAGWIRKHPDYLDVVDEHHRDRVG